MNANVGVRLNSCICRNSIGVDRYGFTVCVHSFHDYNTAGKNSVICRGAVNCEYSVKQFAVPGYVDRLTVIVSSFKSNNSRLVFVQFIVISGAENGRKPFLYGFVAAVSRFRGRCIIFGKKRITVGQSNLGYVVYLVINNEFKIGNRRVVRDLNCRCERLVTPHRIGSCCSDLRVVRRVNHKRRDHTTDKHCGKKNVRKNFLHDLTSKLNLYM